MNQKPIFITGIGTGVGKTFVSAVLVEKLKADYWKPIQSGDLDNSDTDTVKSLITNTISKFHPEAYRFTQPFSPHKSADLDGVKINIDDIILPKTDNQLIIEGAGGLLVPLNESCYIIDLVTKFEADVVLVVQHYLGSINHTLLSIEFLLNRGVNIKGYIINGLEDAYSEQAIRNFSKTPCLGYISYVENINKEMITKLGNQLSI